VNTILDLPHITRYKLNDLDWQNLRAVKQQVAPDQLVKLVQWKPGDVQGIAFGYTVDDDDLPVGAVWHCVNMAYHASLEPALRQMVFGLDEAWVDDVWNVELIGGK